MKSFKIEKEMYSSSWRGRLLGFCQLGIVATLGTMAMIGALSYLLCPHENFPSPHLQTEMLGGAGVIFIVFSIMGTMHGPVVLSAKRMQKFSEFRTDAIKKYAIEKIRRLEEEKEQDRLHYEKIMRHEHLLLEESTEKIDSEIAEITNDYL